LANARLIVLGDDCIKRNIPSKSFVRSFEVDGKPHVPPGGNVQSQSAPPMHFVAYDQHRQAENAARRAIRIGAPTIPLHHVRPPGRWGHQANADSAGALVPLGAGHETLDLHRRAAVVVHQGKYDRYPFCDHFGGI
jgi:hypothetical protein